MFKVDIRKALSKIFNKDIKIFSNGQFDEEDNIFAYIPEEGRFIPLEKLESYQFPEVLMSYKVYGNAFIPKEFENQRLYTMTLLHNGKLLESSKKVGYFGKSFSSNENKSFERDVRKLADEADEILEKHESVMPVHLCD